MMRASVLMMAVALAACGRPDAVAENQHGAAIPEPTNQRSASATGAPPAVGAAPSSPTAGSTATIPAPLHGRWGLSPDDCARDGGAADGLLVVSANGLRFYESQALPAAGAQTDVDSISGEFAFTGEGQQWTKHQSLELQNGKLVRTERNPLGTFTYVRCD